MFKASEDLATYYSALSLPRSVVSQYSKLVDKWLVCNGIDWTVDRCKTLYNDFIRHRAGESLVGSWYKKNKDGLPSGILSFIFKQSLNDEKLFQYMTLLRSYTRFISKETSSKQLEKFLLGVKADDCYSKAIETIVVNKGVQFVGQRRPLIRQPSYLSYQPSPGKRVPTYWGSTLPEEEYWFSQWETIEETNIGRSLRSKYNSIFRDVFAGFTPMRIGVKSFGATGIDAVGKIGLIQEPGLKLRAVANPNRVYQIALKPLGDIIYDTLKELPWDCTFEQSKALPILQKHLQQNRMAYCVDLTGATDYFPLSLQLELLKNLFPNHIDYVNLFEDISRAPWILQGTTIQWTKGQPLGLYPSFGSFALTHGLLLLSLCPNGYENNFFVLGDDVVILDFGLYDRYLKALKTLGCPISANKSITSNEVIEFGGKIITRDYSLPQLKWRNLSDDNFVDIVKLLGIKALRLLRPRQRKVVRLIMDIPDFVGGLGFNPDGLPLEVRYEKYLTLFGKDTGSFLMSLDRKHQIFFNEEKASPNSSRNFPIWNGSELPDLDQRSAALCLKYLPLLSKWYDILGTNLYSVVPNKDVLPIDGFAGKRISLLTQLESRLG